jgi:hypothetical protein
MRFSAFVGLLARALDKKIANRKIGVRNATPTNWGADHSAHLECDQPSFEDGRRSVPVS